MLNNVAITLCTIIIPILPILSLLSAISSKAIIYLFLNMPYIVLMTFKNYLFLSFLRTYIIHSMPFASVRIKIVYIDFLRHFYILAAAARLSLILFFLFFFNIPHGSHPLRLCYALYIYIFLSLYHIAT